MEQKRDTVYVNKKDPEIRIEIQSAKAGEVGYRGIGKDAKLYNGYLYFKEEGGAYIVSTIDASPKRQGLGALLVSALMETQTVVKGQSLPRINMSTAAVSERRFYYGLGFRLDQPMLLYQTIGCPELIPDINRLVTYRPLIDLLYLGFELGDEKSRSGFQPFLDIVPDVEIEGEFWKHEAWDYQHIKGNMEVSLEVKDKLAQTLVLLDKVEVIQLFHLQGQSAFTRLREVVELAGYSNRVTQLVARTNDIAKSAEVVLARNWVKQE